MRGVPRLRRLLRIRLRSLLLLMAAASLLLFYPMKAARDRAQALRTIQELGGDVLFEGRSPTDRPVPRWLTDWLGQDYFRRARWIDLLGENFDDENIDLIRHFPEARAFSSYHSRITDAGMRRLGSMRNLQEVYLGNLSITDKGLDSLTRLRKLTKVQINACSLDVTNAGKEALVDALPQLKPKRDYIARSGSIYLPN